MATRVAAGMPMATASTAMAIAAATWNLASMTRVSPHQRTTVVRDPQVPGPGFRNPTPKNVAIRVAVLAPRSVDTAGIFLDGNLVLSFFGVLDGFVSVGYGG